MGFIYRTNKITRITNAYQNEFYCDMTAYRKSIVPYYWRKNQADNITDVKTFRKLMTEFDVMDDKKIRVVLDRGFCSKRKIDLLNKNIR
ncbi:hypothetical protein [Acetobacterium carbinolicum]|uniref:hypothetical protein n=1 Tax=Acetobacterium carbinolicum TaxID=52690 RepID=UPI003BF47D3E